MLSTLAPFNLIKSFICVQEISPICSGDNKKRLRELGLIRDNSK